VRTNTVQEIGAHVVGAGGGIPSRLEAAGEARKASISPMRRLPTEGVGRRSKGLARTRGGRQAIAEYRGGAMDKRRHAAGVATGAGRVVNKASEGVDGALAVTDKVNGRCYPSYRVSVERVYTRRPTPSVER